MRILDRYIIRRMLGTFVFILALLIVISMVIDFSEKVDNFLEGERATPEVILRYYLNFIPYIGALLGPFFVLVTVIFFTSKMASQSEIVAMTSGGVSFYRLLVPYLIGASILGAGLFYANHYLVPRANHQRLTYEDIFMRHGWTPTPLDVHRRLDENTYLYVAKYRPKDSVATQVTLEHFDGRTLTRKLFGQTMTYSDSTGLWRIHNYRIRRFGETGETIEEGARIDTALAILPDDFGKRVSVKEELTTPQLIDRIEAMKAAGAPYVEFYELERHRRTASAFSVLILTVIGFSIASRKMRGGMGIHIVAALLITALFVLIEKFSTTWTTNADLPAFWGIWIPNIVFMGVAALLVRTAQK